MKLFLETVFICLLMWIICYFSTGSDEKNLFGLRSYPSEVQNIIRNDPKYKDKVKPVNLNAVLLENFILFTVVLFIFGLPIKKDGYLSNFFNVLVLGETLNLFDLVVIDLWWWRNTKRIRFSTIPDKKMYQDPKMHVDSFIRGAIMYLAIALVDGLILTII